MVPQPAETLPYSEFKGLNKSPNQVRCAIVHLNFLRQQNFFWILDTLTASS
ncbi:hypothetical protein PLAN_100448 [Planktothrix rubescens CCAP 1459/22]|uniref:Uncharacterized protein n=1 Tax=Planktothrix rubescens CCAP 1459/22 TaxID=329571 RepID=A0A6J7ZFQ6_PLARU|nr:hypothetical protein PLAN_100448 [Planktothrix rubescens NIVA-CYA 18]